MHPRTRPLIAALFTLFTLAACSEDAAPPPRGSPDTAPEANSVTWHRDVRPLVEAHCASCHATGGIAPMPLLTFEDTDGYRELMVGRVDVPHGTGSRLAMPPWPMSPDCRDVKDARLLTDDEKRTFREWEAAGFPVGDPATYVAPAAPPSTDLGPPSRNLTRPETYTPTRTSPDDYRCFLYPETVSRDTWITAADIVPDAREVVHHVLLFVVPPADVSKIKNLDAASPDVPGYPCVGGSGSNDAQLLAGWVPGMQPIVFPAGSAFPVRAGSRFVAQMHYNTVNLPNGAPVPADATGASLWELTAGQEPLREVRIRAVADLDLDLAAGSPEETEGLTLTTPFSETAVGVIPHMHLLGKRLRLSVTPPDGGTSTCLADIPVWDFHWQQTYMFEDDDQVPLHIGDKVTLECVYDNSAGNQAIVDGVRREPETVRWGEGTFDEMCLAYVITTTPIFSDGGEGECDGFSACYAAECKGRSADPMCAIDCLSWAGPTCPSCAFLPIWKDCATSEGCLVPLASMGACMQGCPADMNIVDCILGSCIEDFTRLNACVDPALGEGQCNDEAQACGIGYVDN
jgi:hypothetical protein